jgi:hypothetical protein
MIDMASQATKNVEVPGQMATHAKINHMFKDHLTKLKSTLHVCLHFFSHDWQFVLNFSHVAEQGG